MSRQLVIRRLGATQLYVGDSRVGLHFGGDYSRSPSGADYYLQSVGGILSLGPIQNMNPGVAEFLTMAFVAPEVSTGPTGELGVIIDIPRDLGLITIRANYADPEKVAAGFDKFSVEAQLDNFSVSFAVPPDALGPVPAVPPVQGNVPTQEQIDQARRDHIISP